MKAVLELVSAVGQVIGALGALMIWGLLFLLLAPIAWALLGAIFAR